MNEQIKLLAKSAGLLNEKYSADFQSIYATQLQKFAELIVVKCANVVWDEADKADSREINEVGYKLLDSFGIKR